MEATCFRMTDAWWDVCSSCWKSNPPSRPTALEIKEKIQAIMHEEVLGNYITQPTVTGNRPKVPGAASPAVPQYGAVHPNLSPESADAAPSGGPHYSYAPPNDPSLPQPPYGQHSQYLKPQAQQAFNQSIPYTRRKGALCIYSDQSARRTGSIGGINDLKTLLMTRFNFHEQEIIELCDHSQDLERVSNKRNITIDSGKDGLETNGVIYPVDFRYSGSITAEDMHNILVRNLPSGCHLAAIFDTPLSGSPLCLPYTDNAMQQARAGAAAPQDDTRTIHATHWSSQRVGRSAGPSTSGSAVCVHYIGYTAAEVHHAGVLRSYWRYDIRICPGLGCV
ncbi:hypothetical protein ID866_8827 [Astraeus odoratus]|nr:hypothetical protein ID866_8827 [Astraeus odoratus]